MNLFRSLLKKQTPAEEFHAAEQQCLEGYEELRRTFAARGTERLLASAVWNVRNWLSTQSQRSDEEMLIAARTSVLTACGFICEKFSTNPETAVDYIAEHPDHIVALMQGAKELYVSQDPELGKRMERGRKYLAEVHSANPEEGMA